MMRTLKLFIVSVVISLVTPSELYAQQTWDATLDVARMFTINADTTNGIKGIVNAGGHIKVTIKDNTYQTLIYQVTLNVTSDFFSGTGETIGSAAGSGATYYPANWNSKDIFTAVFNLDRYYAHRNQSIYPFLSNPLGVKIIVEAVDAQLISLKVPGIGIINAQGGNILFDPQHYCYSLTNNTAPGCSIWLKVKQPNLSKKADLISIAHRGIWGYNQGSGNPENSLLAINSTPAITGIMESDVMQLKDAADIVVSHDYNLNRTSNYSGSDFTYFFNLTRNEITGYKLRKRNTDVYENTNYLLFEDCLNAVMANNIVLTVDIKEQKARYDKNGQCVSNCELYDNKTGDPQRNAQADLNIRASYKTILGKCFQQAKELNALSAIAVKCPYDYDEIKDAIPEDDRGKILYFPVLQSNNDLNQAILFVDSWINKAGNRLMGFETNFKDKDSPFLQPFVKGNKPYQNLWDYIYQSSGLRPACYPEEPMGPRGIVDRWAEWHIKDLGRDIRGDHLQLMTIPYANIMMLTTDRPDVWIEIQKMYNQ